MSAQRVALQKEMRQLQVDQAATMETAAKARRSHIERIRELEAELTRAKSERTQEEDSRIRDLEARLKQRFDIQRDSAA